MTVSEEQADFVVSWVSEGEDKFSFGLILRNEAAEVFLCILKAKATLGVKEKQIQRVKVFRSLVDRKISEFNSLDLA